MIHTAKRVSTLTLALATAAALSGQATARGSNCTYSSQSVFLGCVLPQGGASATDSTALYGGIQFAFGAAKPQTRLVIGARTLHVAADNTAYGADLALRFALRDGITLDSGVLSLVGGQSDALANIGLGYSVPDASWMATVALQADHLRAGADYVFTLGKPAWFIEVNSLAKPAAGSGDLTCPDGFTLAPVGPDQSYDYATPDVILNGQTCGGPIG